MRAPGNASLSPSSHDLVPHLAPHCPNALLSQLQRAAQVLAGPGGTSGWQQLEASFDLQERARLYGANEMCIPVKTTLQLIGSEMWWVAGMEWPPRAYLAASAAKAHVPLAWLPAGCAN